MNLLTELKAAVKNGSRIVVQYRGAASTLTFTGVLGQFYLDEKELVLSGDDFSCSLPYGNYAQTEEGYTFQICDNTEVVFCLAS